MVSKSKRQALIDLNNRKEIFWNMINSLLAGILVFLGSVSTAEAITSRGVLAALVTALIVAITKFNSFWNEEKKEYSHKAFKFI